jgi:hypothetical protein
MDFLAESQQALEQLQFMKEKDDPTWDDAMVVLREYVSGNMRIPVQVKSEDRRLVWALFRRIKRNFLKDPALATISKELVAFIAKKKKRSHVWGNDREFSALLDKYGQISADLQKAIMDIVEDTTLLETDLEKRKIVISTKRGYNESERSSFGERIAETFAESSGKMPEDVARYLEVRKDPVDIKLGPPESRPLFAGGPFHFTGPSMFREKALGTLGGFVQMQNYLRGEDQIVCLTAGHVYNKAITTTGRDGAFLLDEVNWEQNRMDMVAVPLKIERFCGMNTVALSNLSREIYEKLRRSRDKKIYKIGSTTGLTIGRWLGLRSVTIEDDSGAKKTSTYECVQWPQKSNFTHIADPDKYICFATNGDSGSLYFVSYRGKNYPIAIHVRSGRVVGEGQHKIWSCGEPLLTARFSPEEEGKDEEEDDDTELNFEFDEQDEPYQTGEQSIQPDIPVRQPSSVPQFDSLECFTVESSS